MMRKLIIDGNAVYEVDEKCMLRRRIDQDEDQKKKEYRKEEQNQDIKTDYGPVSSAIE